MPEEEEEDKYYISEGVDDFLIKLDNIWEQNVSIQGEKILNSTPVYLGNTLNMVDPSGGKAMDYIASGFDADELEDDNVAGDIWDNYVTEKYVELDRLSKESQKLDTGKGIVGGFKEGSIPDVALGISNAIVSTVTTIVPAILTRGASIPVQIMTPMYTEYNTEKAKALYPDDDFETAITKLHEKGEDDWAVPTILGVASVYMERIGMKGVTNAIVNRASTAGAKRASQFFMAGLAEGTTEWFQGGIQEMSTSIAQQEKDPMVMGERIIGHMFSEDGLEEFLQGFAGGGITSAAGNRISRAFRGDKDNLIINDYVNQLGELNQSKLKSFSPDVKLEYDKKIKKVQDAFRNHLILDQTKSTYLTEDQSYELLDILDSKQNLDSRIKKINKQRSRGAINEQDYKMTMEGIDLDVQGKNKRINDIKVDANKRLLNDELRTTDDAMSKINGMSQKVYKTQGDFLTAVNSKLKGLGGKLYTAEDLRYSDGLIIDGEVMINEAVAAENNAITAGSHELLHGIVKSSLNGTTRTVKDSNGNDVRVQLTKDGEQLIRDFRDSLTTKERNIVQKRIDDNYRFNKDGSEKAFEQYAEEYITAYSDAAGKGQITPGALTKIKKFFENTFNSGDKGYKNLNFETGKDVKEFLQAYSEDRKQGKFRDQFVSMAQKGVDMGKDGTVKESITKKDLTNKEKQAEVNKLGEKYTDKIKTDGQTVDFEVKDGNYYWQVHAEDISDEIQKQGLLDGLILEQLKDESINRKDFLNTSYERLFYHLKNYKPERNLAYKEENPSKATGLFGWLNPQIGNKTSEAYNIITEGEVKNTTQIGETTKEGDIKIQLEADEDLALIDLETRDMSPAAEAKRVKEASKKKEQRYSKLRQDLGIENDSDLYNKVKDSARKSLILAYKKTRNIKDKDVRVTEVAKMIADEYAGEKGITSGKYTELFKLIKNSLGEKQQYITNLKKNRESIVESIFTSDFVQIEKKVTESERVFTVFKEKLTSQPQVESAVNKGLLPKDSLKTIDKGQSVNLYKKVMPNPNEFVGFFDQPLITSEGKRSGLKGTRKDGLAKHLSKALIFDALIEVRQEQFEQELETLKKETQDLDPKAQQKLIEEFEAQLDVVELAAKISREVDVKFSKSNAVTDMNNAMDLGVNTGVYSEIRFSKSHREQYEKQLNKRRPDLTEEQRKNAVQSVFDFVDGKDIPNNKKSKYEKMAMHYTANGFLILPEDGYKVIEAERVATIKKLDPFSYKNPNVLIEDNVVKKKVKRTNPDNINTFTNKTEYGNGVVVYNVEDSKDGQLDVRKVIDSHFGEKSNPWCLAARVERTDQQYGNFDNRQEAERFADEWKARGYEVEISLLEKQGKYEVYADLVAKDKSAQLDNAFTHWESYNKKGNGHKIAFHNGELNSFRDGNQMQWWDRNDKAFDAPVIRGKKDKDGFKPVSLAYKNNIEAIFSEKQVGDNQNGTYTKRRLDGVVVDRETKKDGKFHGERMSIRENVSSFYDTRTRSTHYNSDTWSKITQERFYKDFKNRSGIDVMSFGIDEITLDNITKWNMEMFDSNSENVPDTKIVDTRGEAVRQKKIFEKTGIYETVVIESFDWNQTDGSTIKQFVVEATEPENKTITPNVLTVEGTVNQKYFDFSKDPDALKKEFPSYTLEQLTYAHNRYYSIQGKKVKIVLTGQGNSSETISLTIDGVEQDFNPKFSETRKIEIEHELTAREENILLPSYINKEINRLKNIQDISTEESELLEILEEMRDLNGSGAVNIHNIMLNAFPYAFNNLVVADFSSEQSFVDAIKKNTQAQMKINAYNTSKRILEKQTIGLLPEQAVPKIVDYLINLGRDVRSALIIPTNKGLQIDLIDGLQDGKFKSYFIAEPIFKGSNKYKIQYKNSKGEFVDVEIYDSVKKIKQNINKPGFRNEFNEQAKRAKEYRLNLLDPENRDHTLGDKLDNIELANTGTRGGGRKTAKVDAAITTDMVLLKKHGIKLTELILEHEVTIKNMKSYERAYAKGDISREQMNSVYEQNKVHIFPKGIDTVLQEAGKVSQRLGMGYESIPAAENYLIDLREKLIIDKLPDSLEPLFERKSENFKDMVLFSKSTNKPAKGITILDFDDTLATSSSLIRFTRPNGTRGTLTPEQYANTYQDLLGLDYKFDFSEFNKVVDGKPAPLLNKAKKLAGKFGTDNMFILTARPKESAVAIQKFLKENGLNIPLKNITGLGNSTADAKALWVLDKAAEGYNDFYFADDAIQNVEAVQNMLNQIDVKSKVQQARADFSKSKIDTYFNSILEDISGINANQTISEKLGEARGKSKGKFRYFVPPSHEDFVGLLYNFMGSGKKGNNHRDFFNKVLIKPLNRAYRTLNAHKQVIANNYKKLAKHMPQVTAILGDKVPSGDFTYEDAMRVYLWNKAGYKIPGISSEQEATLVGLVKEYSDLKKFADMLGRVSLVKEGYVKPGDNWLSGSIKFDLVDATGRSGRAKFFKEFIENSEMVFGKLDGQGRLKGDNINKIESIYGKDFREALEDILYRTINGTNRPSGTNKMVNAWLDWINGSVGAIMFFNMRSAVLQQLSIANFMNFADNNVVKAAARFADQKQFWDDFTFLFNSDYLKQRRAGAAFDVNANEIAREVSGARNPVRAAIRKLLDIGFTPTQMGDSFAIATGGASFYRNRVNTYIKQGLSKKEAQSKAFLDFQEIAEETQQSARPDMISQQQASPLGRFILAFQNVTSQYARIVKKSSLDLIKRRISKGYTTQSQSDTANLSRIMYYGAIQSVIFYGMQQALFAMMFSDDEEDEEFFKTKKDRVVHGVFDSLLKGSGIYGAVVSTLKNYVIKLVENNKSDAFFKTPAWEELLQIAPPIGIKVRKWRSAERTIEWNKDVIKNMSLFSLDNPIYDAISSGVEGFTNIPLNRLYKKVQNIRASLDSENAWWQRISVALGWSKWDVGIDGKIDKKDFKDKGQEKENKELQKIEKEEGKKVLCAAVSNKGTRCGNEVLKSGSYCTIHTEVEESKSGEKKQCKGRRTTGGRCKMQTNSKSGYCYYHD